MSIRVRNVSKFYGKQKALNDVSFAVDTGKIVGFLGPNGAGKSTMMKIISGYLPAGEGEVWVNDIPVNGNSLEVKRAIGYLPEHNPLYLDMYIREYLEFVAGTYGIRKVRNRIDEMLELTGLTKESHKIIGALSKGYRQRVGLAQALIHDPSVLILDEPTTGLDPNQLVEIRQLIREISNDKTVMLSTHIMQEVEAICDRIVIIHNGRIVADDSREKVKLSSRGNMKKVKVEFLEDVNPGLFQNINGIAGTEALESNQWLFYGSGEDIRPEIYRFAVENNLTLLTLNQESSSLENVFREMTRE